MGAIPGSAAIGLLSVLMLTASAAVAQPITPGGVQDTLKPRPTLPQLHDSSAVETEASLKPKTSLDALAQTVVVRSFSFSGNNQVPSADLQALLAGYLGRPITITDLYEAADKLTAYYNAQGYTLASALIPAQKISEGSIRIEIVEGLIGAVRYEGLRRYRQSQLASRIGIQPGSLYRGREFERKVRLLNTLPGLEVRAKILPGEDYGSADIVINAREKLLQGQVFADNGGSEAVGRFRGGALVTVNNPLTLADQLTLTGMRSSGGLLNYYSAAYSLPLGRESSRLVLSYGQADFDIAGPFTGISGSNRVLHGEVLLPLLAKRGEQFDLTLGGTNTRANADFSGTTFSQSDVTVAELSGRYALQRPSGYSLQTILGLVSNFQQDDSPIGTTSVPLKMDLLVQQSVRLPAGLQLALLAQFVYGRDALPDTQKWSIGGPNSVRGYGPAEARGDWGYLGQLSLSRNLAIGPVLVSPHVFYDLGVTRQHQADRYPTGSAPSDAMLAAAGAGADLGWRSLTLKLDYAVPTTNAPASDGRDDGRFYGAFAYVF